MYSRITKFCYIDGASLDSILGIITHRRIVRVTVMHLVEVVNSFHLLTIWGAT